MDYQTVQKRVEVLAKRSRKEYTLERSINNYHLMQGNKFIVIDEPLTVVYIVLNAMIRDKTQQRKPK